jgi:repressor LexA
MTKLSERQHRILAFIRSYSVDQGKSPTVREIGKACGITSTSVVRYNLEKLKDAGLLERDASVSRGARLAGARYVVPGDTLHVVVDGAVVEGTYVEV